MKFFSLIFISSCSTSFHKKLAQPLFKILLSQTFFKPFPQYLASKIFFFLVYEVSNSFVKQIKKFCTGVHQFNYKTHRSGLPLLLIIGVIWSIHYSLNPCSLWLRWLECFIMVIFFKIFLYKYQSVSVCIVMWLGFFFLCAGLLLFTVLCVHCCVCYSLATERGGSSPAAVTGGSSPAAVKGVFSLAAVGGGSSLAAVRGGSSLAALRGGSSLAAVGGAPL